MAIADAAAGLLNAVRRGRGRLGREAPAKVPRTANGTIPPATPEVLPPLSPGMRGRLPKGMAELVVYPVGSSDSFGLTGAYGDKLAQPLGGAGKPGFDFNSLAVQLEQTVRIATQMASWSREERQLTKWLNESTLDAEQHSTEFALVVWDDTGFRIPWELFWLTDPEKRRRPNFLGALMTVIRWLDMTPSTHVQNFTRDPGQANGPVAAYVYDKPEDPGNSMARDKELLQDFQVKYEDSMSDLLTSLHNPDDAALAMVYAACHGEFGDGPGECSLGELTLESANMQADNGFHRLHNRQTLVFLNACASGPVGEDSGRYNDGALRGFPKMFLETGAAGVLATAAPIESDFAHQAARGLFERLRVDPNLPVARAVRDLRREAVDSLPPDIWRTDVLASQQQTANATLLPVLYWFMYLYYGSPRMAISFAGTNDPPASN
jgi:CHAT domain